MTILGRIKRAVLARRIRQSEKVRIEMFRDGLTEQDLIEAIANARRIDKSLHSTNPRTGQREVLHVIISPNLQGLLLYTKGKLIAEAAGEVYYFFVSAKASD